MYFELTSQ